MSNYCYICGTTYYKIVNSSHDSNDPEINSSYSDQLIDTFTKSVLKFRTLISHSRTRTEPEHSVNSVNEFHFCLNCQAELESLNRDENTIQELQRKCEASKENLLLVTLSTIIKKVLVNDTVGQDLMLKPNHVKSIGLFAAKIAKNYSTVGFKIYKKWKNKFIKSLQNQLAELAIANPNLNLCNNSSSNLYSHDEEGINAVLNSSVLGSYIQTDHSYFSSPNSFLKKENISFSRRRKSIGKVYAKKNFKMSKPRKYRQNPTTSTFELNNTEVRNCVEALDNVDTDKQKQLIQCSDFSLQILQNDKDDNGEEERTDAEIHNLALQVLSMMDKADNDKDSNCDMESQNDSNEPEPILQRLQSTPSVLVNVENSDLIISESKETESVPAEKPESSNQEKKNTFFQCPVENCKKIFKKRKLLNVHKNIHEGIKKYLCDTCGALFLSLPSLHSHRKTHLGLKPYVCQICQQSFRSAGHLTSHNLIHSGERPFSCSVCEKTFNRKENLRAHKITHSQEKPHKCPTCPTISFTRRTLLRKHMLEKHKSNKTPTESNIIIKKPTKITKPQPSPSPRFNEDEIEPEEYYFEPTAIVLQYAATDTEEIDTETYEIDYNYNTDTAYLTLTREHDPSLEQNEVSSRGQINETNFVEQALLLPDGNYLLIQ